MTQCVSNAFRNTIIKIVTVIAVLILSISTPIANFSAVDAAEPDLGNLLKNSKLVYSQADTTIPS